MVHRTMLDQFKYALVWVKQYFSYSISRGFMLFKLNSNLLRLTEILFLFLFYDHEIPWIIEMNFFFRVCQ
jgi:hypothetical protein